MAASTHRSHHFPALRIGLYLALSIFSIVLLALTAIRLHDTLNAGPGVGFHDRIVVELLVTSALAILWSWFLIHTIHSLRVNGPVSTFRGEAIGWFIIWVMFLVGTAIATNKWANLGVCFGVRQCDLLTAIVALAWLCFITMTLIGFFTMLFLARNSGYGANTSYGGLHEPLHGRRTADPSMTTAPGMADTNEHADLYEQADDLAGMQAANLTNLPENYVMKFWMYHITTWPQLSFVAENDKGHIVGYVLAKIEEEPEEKGSEIHGHVNSISVLRSYRRLGLAKRLMLLSQHAMASIYGAKFVSLHVRYSNIAAIGLYRDTLGFEVAEVEKKYYGDGEDAYVMKLSLKDSA